MTDVLSVTDRMLRPRSFEMFADLPAVPAVVGFEDVDAETRVTFAGPLTPEQVAAIHARMTSRDDTDQARRAALAADRDANTAALAADDADPAHPMPVTEREWRAQNIHIIDAILGGTA